MKCKKVKVVIKKYNFYSGKKQTLNRNISTKEFREIKSWQKHHPEFSNAYSIKKVGGC
jgi:hypothetical protein